MRVLKILFISVLLLSTNSCFLYNGPEDDDSNTEISGEIVDAPNWDLSDYSIYECNMTVIGVVPQFVTSDLDELAFFCGDECRGVAEKVQLYTDESVWIGMIYGDLSTFQISCKYYSESAKKIYECNEIEFGCDKKLGTIDSPFEILFD